MRLVPLGQTDGQRALAALEARDGARLAEILKRHLRNKCETVKESLTAAM